MNSNEIKKALECCNSIDEEQCIACPYYKTGGGCVMQMSEDALAYINQLETEVERLNTENRILSQKRFNIFERLEFTDKIRVEARTFFLDAIGRFVW